MQVADFQGFFLRVTFPPQDFSISWLELGLGKSELQIKLMKRIHYWNGSNWIFFFCLSVCFGV